MLTIEKTAILLMQMQPQDWEGAVFAALDAFSLQRQQDNPKLAATEIEAASKDWVDGLVFAIAHGYPDHSPHQQSLHEIRRSWWRTASQYPSSTWNCRPVPTAGVK